MKPSIFLPLIFMNILSVKQAFAFDPFSMIDAGRNILSDASDFVGGISDIADEIDAATELSEELGLKDKSSSNYELREYVDQIREIEETLYSAGYTKSEVESFTLSLRRGTNSFAQNVRELTLITRRIKGMSRLALKLGNLVGLTRNSSGEKKSLENDANSLKIQKDIQSELLKIELQNLKEKAKTQLAYKKIRDEEAKNRKEFIGKINRTSAPSRSHLNEPVIAQLGFAILGIVVMISGLLYGCGLSTAGRLLFISSLSCSIFFLIIRELIDMIQRSVS